MSYGLKLILKRSITWVPLYIAPYLHIRCIMKKILYMLDEVDADEKDHFFMGDLSFD